MYYGKFPNLFLHQNILLEPLLKYILYFFYFIVYPSSKFSVTSPSKLQSHNIHTLSTCVNLSFHSTTIAIALLLESIYLIPVSNNLLIPVGVRVPSV